MYFYESTVQQCAVVQLPAHSAHVDSIRQGSIAQATTGIQNDKLRQVIKAGSYKFNFPLL